MSGIYKFLDHKDIDRVIGGSLKFGRLKFYRLLEYIYGPKIGDRLDGEQRSYLHGIVDLCDPINAQLRAELEDSRDVKIIGGNRIIFNGLRTTNEVDGFAFSFSIGEIRALMEEFCSGTDGYDSCISIACVDSLIDAVYNGTVNGLPVAQLFDVSHDKVTYDATPHDLRLGPAPVASPFRKDRFFERQQEFRIFLRPKLARRGDEVFVQIENRGELLAPTTVGTSEKAVLGDPAAARIALAAMLPDALQEVDRIPRELFEQRWSTRLVEQYWIVRPSLSLEEREQIDMRLVAPTQFFFCQALVRMLRPQFDIR